MSPPLAARALVLDTLSRFLRIRGLPLENGRLEQQASGLLGAVASLARQAGLDVALTWAEVSSHGFPVEAHRHRAEFEFDRRLWLGADSTAWVTIAWEDVPGPAIVEAPSLAEALGQTWKTLGARGRWAGVRAQAEPRSSSLGAFLRPHVLPLFEQACAAARQRALDAALPRAAAVPPPRL